MKIYKRQIRPMIIPPALHGFSCIPSPLLGEDAWFDEDNEDRKGAWEMLIKDPMSRLDIEERYVCIGDLDK